ncbi:MAG: hypothetical protein AB2556_25055, partial [Candidatus Thiodiazotropha sp.]
MYYDGSQPQYIHFRASMLAYAHINLISMLSRFEPNEAVRVATDSIYVKKTTLCKLEGVMAYKPHEVHPKGYCRICLICHDKATPRPPRDGIASAQWRDKGEQLYIPLWHAVYLPNPEYVSQVKDVPDSTVPRYDNPLTRHQLSYLNGGGGSGKTMRASSSARKKPLSSPQPIAYPKRCRPEGLIKLVKIPQELTKSEPNAYPKHQRERWTNTSSQTIKLQLTSRV